MSRDGAPVAVLGLGNVLMQDDAFGPWVVAALEAGWDVGEDVEVVDAGTPGLDLTPFLLGRDAVVIVDTVRAGGEPGELRRYGMQELLAVPPQPRLSPHDPGLKETLLLLDLDGRGPSDVVLVGAIPASVATGTTMTPALRAAIPGAIEVVLAELRRLGAKVAPRAVPRPADVWWERS